MSKDSIQDVLKIWSMIENGINFFCLASRRVGNKAIDFKQVKTTKKDYCREKRIISSSWSWWIGQNS